MNKQKKTGLGAAALATRWIFLVVGIATSSWAPMVPYAQARLGLNDAQLGLVLLAFGGGSALSMPFVGWLAPRYGNRRIISIAGVMLCLALPLLALVASSTLLALALFYFGATIGAVDVAMNAHAVEVERAETRPLMSGFHGLFSIGGLTGAAAISGMLALGLPLLACTLWVSLLLAVIILSQRSRLLSETRRVSGQRFAFRLPKSLLLIGTLCFFSFLAEGAMLDWSALLLRDFRGYSAAFAGIGYACFSVAMAAGRLTGDRVIARLGPVWTVRIGAVVASLGLLMSALMPWHALALPGFALIGLGAANIVPVMFSAAGRLPNVAPAASIAVVTTIGYGGLLLGPALIGFIAHGSSLPTALVVVAGLLLLVAASAGIVRSAGAARR